MKQMIYTGLHNKLKYGFSFFLFIFIIFFFNDKVIAAQLEPTITLSNGNGSGNLSDSNYNTSISFRENDTITVQSEGNLITGLYIIWDSPVTPWSLTALDQTIACGTNGFLHEYIPISAATSSVTINIPSGGLSICDIRAFSEGALPSDVQVWNPPHQKADIAIVAAHADDEILFFGGILPTYGVEKEAKVQIIYMSQFWTSAKIREHEKLDGLWASGITHYPVCGNFEDLFSQTIEAAQAQYSLDDMVNYLTSEIRKFQPQVIVTHDEKGEYGHGFHMLTSKAVTLAVEAAADSGSHPESLAAYGVWNTPKTYLHLYSQNKITLNLRTPLPSMDNRTAIDIASAAYKQHVSQQWCWFYVSDEYEYSCADFGLYRTTVGNDTGNDLLENIKTYQVQQEEYESMSIAEAESESASLAQAEQESISLAQAEAEKKTSADTKENTSPPKKSTVIIIIIIIAISFILLMGYNSIRLKRKRRR